MRYVNRTDVCTHTQTKFSFEHTSVGLAHARPMMNLDDVSILITVARVQEQQSPPLYILYAK